MSPLEVESNIVLFQRTVQIFKELNPKMKTIFDFEKYLSYVFLKYNFSIDFLSMKQISFLVVVFAILGVIFSVFPSVYAQTSGAETSEQTTLTGDLLNDPVALEILQKIEESKKKIAKLEQQNFDNLQAQKFLEERRAVALDRLNQALISWEEKWHEFSPKIAYQKFIDKLPSGVQGTFAKQFEFTEKKHELGVTAKTHALDNGMTSQKALEKFNNAAKSTVAEINSYNETIQPDTPEEIRTKIAILVGKSDDFNRNYFYKHAAFKGELSAKYAIAVDNERVEFKDVLKKYNSGMITHKELSEQITEIGEKYSPIKEKILEDNSKSLSEFERKQVNHAQSIIYGINNSDVASSHIEAVWDSKTNSIKIMKK